MTELFTHYEQQFGNISAEITAKICKIPNLHGCEFNCEFDNLLKLTRVVASFKLKTALFYFFPLASKKGAVSDVERCFDEARELVRNERVMISRLTDIIVFVYASYSLYICKIR